MFWTSNHRFWLKYESSIHNITSSREKVILFESGEKSAQIIQSDNGWSVIMNLDFGQKQQFEVKNVLIDLFLTNTHLLALQDVHWWSGVVWITCGLLWCFYQLFGLSFWRHPFTAEDPLLSKWCNAMLYFSKSDEETNKTDSWDNHSLNFKPITIWYFCIYHKSLQSWSNKHSGLRPSAFLQVPEVFGQHPGPHFPVLESQPSHSWDLDAAAGQRR